MEVSYITHFYSSRLLHTLWASYDADFLDEMFAGVHADKSSITLL